MLKVASLLVLSTGALAYTCTEPTITSNKTVISSTGGLVGPSTRLQSRNELSLLQISCSPDLTFTRLEVYYPMLGTWHFPQVKNVTAFGVNQYGQFVIKNSSFTKVFGTQRALGSYDLNFWDGRNGLVAINDTNNNVVWTDGLSATHGGWGYKFASDKGFHAISDEVGNLADVHIYELDSYKNNNDPEISHQALVNAVLETAADKVITSTIKITLDDTTNVFNEKSLVQGIQKALGVAESLTKIINFSGVLDKGNSPVVNCAIQWAYNSGAYFIAAAGNENKTISRKNPYQLLVGAVDFDYVNSPDSMDYQLPPPSTDPVYPWSMTNYGSALDIWGPNQLNFVYLHGTSIATSFVSVIAGYAVTKYTGMLGKNPANGYNYLKATARTDMFDYTDHYKFNQSRNAQNRYISILDMNTTPTSATKPTTDYCSALNLPYSNPTSSNWNTLISLAQTTNMGHLVAFTGVPFCPCSGITCRC